MIERVDITPVAGLHTQAGLLLAMLDDSTANWRGELGAASDAAVVWQPAPQAHSIGALILHIADVEAHWLHHVGAGEVRSSEELARLLSKETRQYDVSWPRPPAQPLSWFLAQHDDVRAHTRRVVSTWEDLDQARPARGAEFTRRWLLYHALRHEAYHGGQAVLISILHARH